MSAAITTTYIDHDATIDVESLTERRLRLKAIPTGFADCSYRRELVRQLPSITTMNGERK